MSPERAQAPEPVLPYEAKVSHDEIMAAYEDSPSSQARRVCEAAVNEVFKDQKVTHGKLEHCIALGKPPVITEEAKGRPVVWAAPYEQRATFGTREKGERYVVDLRNSDNSAEDTVLVYQRSDRGEGYLVRPMSREEYNKIVVSAFKKEHSSPPQRRTREEAWVSGELSINQYHDAYEAANRGGTLDEYWEENDNVLAAASSPEQLLAKTQRAEKVIAQLERRYHEVTQQAVQDTAEAVNAVEANEAARAQDPEFIEREDWFDTLCVASMDNMSVDELKAEALALAQLPDMSAARIESLLSKARVRGADRTVVLAAVAADARRRFDEQVRNGIAESEVEAAHAGMDRIDEQVARVPSLLTQRAYIQTDTGRAEEDRRRQLEARISGLPITPTTQEEVARSQQLQSEVSASAKAQEGIRRQAEIREQRILETQSNGPQAEREVKYAKARLAEMDRAREAQTLSQVTGTEGMRDRLQAILDTQDVVFADREAQRLVDQLLNRVEELEKPPVEDTQGVMDVELAQMAAEPVAEPETVPKPLTAGVRESP